MLANVEVAHEAIPNLENQAGRHPAKKEGQKWTV